MKNTKRILFFMLLSLLLLCLASCGGGEEEEQIEFIETPYKGSTLYIYNWGEYISDGSEGSLDVVDLFEKTYGITVKYDYFSTNEELYGQLSKGAAYDVIFPSDYMIERMIGEDLLQPLDFDLLQNEGNIMEQYLNRFYDPENLYTVPYSVGMIGIVYNTKLVDPEDVADKSWDLLWNPKYAGGQLINFNNPRDGFGVSMLHLGMSLNTTDTADWDKAYRHLRDQDCIYLMDEVFNKMENGSAAAAAYYAGDCITMMDVNPDLAFYYPREGTNVFIDAMCIPKSAENVGAAHLFIDFMLSADVATQNANYISYASPNREVVAHPDYDHVEGTAGYEILYEIPEGYLTDPMKMQYYHNLDDETLKYMTDLWTRLGIEEDEGGLEYGTIVFLGLIGVGLVYVLVHYGKKAYVYMKTQKQKKLS